MRTFIIWYVVSFFSLIALALWLKDWREIDREIARREKNGTAPWSQEWE